MTLIFIEKGLLISVCTELTKIIVTVARNGAILKLIFNLKVKYLSMFTIESADLVYCNVCYLILRECLHRSG